MSGNQALNINAGIAPQADLAITSHGSDWYWTVCALMTSATLLLMGLSYTKPPTHRLFHYLTAAVTLVASIAYFTMAAGLGQTPIAVEFPRPASSAVAAAGTRQVFYVRYIDWAITTPLLLLDLLLTAGAPTPTILITLLADEFMVVCALVAALTATSYKWGYWTFGALAFFYVLYTVLFVGRRQAAALSGPVARTYLTCAVVTVVVWSLYPIAWGLSEGGNVIHPDSEAIFYGILDLLAQPVFGFLLVFGHRNIDPAELGLHFHDLTTVVSREKHANGNQHHAVNGSPEHV